MKGLFFIIFSCISFSSLSQMGYFGRKNLASIEFNVVPSFGNSIRFDSKNNYTLSRLRIGYPILKCSYGRVLPGRSELSISYRFTKGYTKLYRSKYVTRDSIYNLGVLESVNEKFYDFLEDPWVFVHSFTLDYKLYKKSSLAPLGKYWGTSLEYGFSRFNSEELLIGEKDIPISNNFFSSKEAVKEIDTLLLPSRLPSKYICLNILWGRNLPITDKYLFSFSIRAPVLRFISVNAPLFENVVYRDVPFLYDDQEKFDRIQWILLSKYSGVSINVGLLLAL